MQKKQSSDTTSLTRRELLEVSGRLGVGLGIAGAGLSAVPARGEGLGRAAHDYREPAEAVAQPASSRQAAGANDTLALALIGCGGMGRGNMDGLMNHRGVTVAAVCDPDARHMAEAARMVEAKFGKRPAEHKDFRRVMEMKDVDAVIVATPDHWHALPTIAACQAGKDIFLEKPISHNIVEGMRMVEAARKHNRMIQVNTWQRSVQHFIDAIDYVRAGKIGKIHVCRSWKTGHAGQGRQQPKEPPREVDYDLWVGPAVFEPFQENRFHGNWRWFLNYGGGLSGDWGVHLMDIILLGMAKDDNALPMPKRVASYGGKLVCGAEDDRTTPDTQMAIYEYPDWTLFWEVHVGNPGLDGGGDHGSLFIGTEGRVLVDRGGWSIFDKAGKPVEKPQSSTRRGGDHQQNWLDAVKSRDRSIIRSEIGSMHDTTTLCHLANLAWLHGGSLEWDAKRQVVTNDKSAMDLLAYRREYRKPWSLPNV